MARIHPCAPMLLEEGSEFSLALARGASQVYAEIDIPEPSAPYGRIARNGHASSEATSSTRKLAWSAAQAASPSGGRASDTTPGHRQGVTVTSGTTPLGPDRSSSMEIAPALAQLAPAEMGVDMTADDILGEQLDSGPRMVLQRHAWHHNRRSAQMFGHPAEARKLPAGISKQLGLSQELGSERKAERVSAPSSSSVWAVIVAVKFVSSVSTGPSFVGFSQTRPCGVAL